MFISLWIAYKAFPGIASPLPVGDCGGEDAIRRRGGNSSANQGAKEMNYSQFICGGEGVPLSPCNELMDGTVSRATSPTVAGGAGYLQHNGRTPPAHSLYLERVKRQSVQMDKRIQRQISAAEIS